MNILALDTSTSACSVALAYLNQDGQQHILSRHEVIPRQHTAEILPMIQSILDEAGLKVENLHAIAFGAGPGSLTGIRIAVSVAKGLAFGQEIPLIPLSSLGILAQTAFDTHGCESIAVAVDARMEEVYFGLYRIENKKVIPVVADQVIKPALLAPITSDYFAVGDGFKIYQETLLKSLETTPLAIDVAILPQATSMLELAKESFAQGRFVDVNHAIPHYLR